MSGLPNPNELEKLIDGLDDEAAAEIRQLVERLRIDITALIAVQDDLTFEIINRIRPDIVSRIQQFENEMMRTVDGEQGFLTKAAETADDLIISQMAIDGLPNPGLAAEHPTLKLIRSLQTTAVTGVSDLARARILRELQLAALGQTDFGTLMQRIGRNLNSPSVFGTIATRSEVIARTGVSQMYNQGTLLRGNDLASRHPGLRKTWTHATGRLTPKNAPRGVYRARENHVALNGKNIPWSEKFSVGGVRASGPHDKVLPARETVNCKCRLTLDFSRVDSNAGLLAEVS